MSQLRFWISRTSSLRGADRVRTVALLALLLVVVSPASAADRVIGLLSLPEVFGNGPCDAFEPKEILLYAEPESDRVIGAIRVTQPWTFHTAGGCGGLMVRVYDSATGRISDLPTKEYAYEAPAVIVLEQRGGWFKIRLGDGTAWLRASVRDEYFPLERLVTNALTYLTEAWDGRLAASPGAKGSKDVRRSLPQAEQQPDVRVVRSRRLGDELWIDIEILSHSVCHLPEKARVVARGWLRAHNPSGEPAIWFFSRGC